MLNSTPTISIPVAKSDVQSSMTGSQGSAASFLQIFRYIHTDLLKSLSQKILLILLPSAEETLQEEEKCRKESYTPHKDSRSRARTADQNRSTFLL
jgi:hypothetical protein